MYWSKGKKDGLSHKLRTVYNTSAEWWEDWRIFGGPQQRISKSSFYVICGSDTPCCTPVQPPSAEF